MIIKPLEEEYKLVTLGVTSIESAIHPNDFFCTEEQLFEAGMLGHACGSIIQHTAFSKEQGMEVNNMYINMLQHLQNSPSQKSKTFYNNLVAGNIVTIGTRYKSLATETPLYYRIECGKYLVFIKSGGCDMIGVAEDGRKIIYDNKLYGKFFKDMAGLFMGTKYKNSDKEQEILTKPYDGKVYSMHETNLSDLKEKLQWWMYPLMVGIDDYVYFQYNVIVKNEATNKNLMPNVQEIRIKITKEEAETLLRNTIVEVFKHHFDKEKNCLIDNKN